MNAWDTYGYDRQGNYFYAPIENAVDAVDGPDGHGRESRRSWINRSAYHFVSDQRRGGRALTRVPGAAAHSGFAGIGQKTPEARLVQPRPPRFPRQGASSMTPQKGSVRGHSFHVRIEGKKKAGNHGIGAWQSASGPAAGPRRLQDMPLMERPPVPAFLRPVRIPPFCIADPWISAPIISRGPRPAPIMSRSIPHALLPFRHALGRFYHLAHASSFGSCFLSHLLETGHITFSK